MATITGSSNINWSAVPFDPVNFQGDVVNFKSLMTQALTDVANERFTLLSVSPNSLTVNVASGGTVVLSGGVDFPFTINSVTLFHPSGQILQMNGTIDLVGNTDTLTSISITSG